MWSSIGTAGALAFVGVALTRVAVVWIALRGTKPAERAEIIRALRVAEPTSGRGLRRPAR